MNQGLLLVRTVAVRLLACIFLTHGWPCALGQSAIQKLLHSTIPVFAASATDSIGNVYVVGYTTQDVIATTPGTFQRQFVAGSCPEGVNGQCAHSFVIKVSADGARVLYATYLGGSRSDVARAITIDSSGSALVTGATSSLDFPVSAAANRRDPGPGFVTRLSPDGSALLASSYLSGEPWKLALDSIGNVYIAGVTRNQGFLTTMGAFQTTFRGGTDAFVLKLDPGLSTLIYSTFLGGSSGDLAYALAVDSQGNAYVGGFSDSKVGSSAGQPFPVTPGAYVGPGGSGAFVAKLNPDGSRLVFASILGDGYSHDLVVDSSGNVYVGGGANSGFPYTPGAFMKTGEGFAAKLSADGSHLLFATHLPSYSAGIVPQMYGVSLIQGDHLLVWDFSPQQVHTNPDAPYPCTTQGSTDSYLFELNAEGSDRVYGTYLPDAMAVTGSYVWSVSQDQGKLLDRMPLHGFGTPGPTCVSSAATFYSGPIAPGEFVSIFGIDIGPDQPELLKLDATGKVGTFLGGLSVYFNGVAAPLSYVSKNQINAVVPFELAGLKSTSVMILKNGVSFPPVQANVVAASPGIFRVGDNYAIVNLDGTLNSPSHPAALGSIVTVYATGAGLMQPAPETGSLGDGTTAIALRARPELHYQGIGSQIFNGVVDCPYAGDAPTLVQGVVVIQARIPDRIPPGIISTALVVFFGEGNTLPYSTAGVPIFLN